MNIIEINRHFPDENLSLRSKETKITDMTSDPVFVPFLKKLSVQSNIWFFIKSVKIKVLERRVLERRVRETIVEDLKWSESSKCHIKEGTFDDLLTRIKKSVKKNFPHSFYHVDQWIVEESKKDRENYAENKEKVFSDFAYFLGDENFSEEQLTFLYHFYQNYLERYCGSCSKNPQYFNYEQMQNSFAPYVYAMRHLIKDKAHFFKCMTLFEGELKEHSKRIEGSFFILFSSYYRCYFLNRLEEEKLEATLEKRINEITKELEVGCALFAPVFFEKVFGAEELKTVPSETWINESKRHAEFFKRKWAALVRTNRKEILENKIQKDEIVAVSQSAPQFAQDTVLVKAIYEDELCNYLGIDDDGEKDPVYGSYEEMLQQVVHRLKKESHVVDDLDE